MPRIWPAAALWLLLVQPVAHGGEAALPPCQPLVLSAKNCAAVTGSNAWFFWPYHEGKPPQELAGGLRVDVVGHDGFGLIDLMNVRLPSGEVGYIGLSQLRPAR